MSFNSSLSYQKFYRKIAAMCEITLNEIKRITSLANSFGTLPKRTFPKINANPIARTLSVSAPTERGRNIENNCVKVRAQQLRDMNLNYLK